jgi:hypothetical protein
LNGRYLLWAWLRHVARWSTGILSVALSGMTYSLNEA